MIILGLPGAFRQRDIQLNSIHLDKVTPREGVNNIISTHCEWNMSLFQPNSFFIIHSDM